MGLSTLATLDYPDALRKAAQLLLAERDAALAQVRRQVQQIDARERTLTRRELLSGRS